MCIMTHAIATVGNVSLDGCGCRGYSEVGAKFLPYQNVVFNIITASHSWFEFDSDIFPL